MSESVVANPDKAFCGQGFRYHTFSFTVTQKFKLKFALMGTNYALFEA
jgi:hypothetical protein